MGASMQSVTELWVQVYTPLQNYGCKFTAWYRTMGAIVQSVIEYVCKCTVYYRTMCASIRSVTELWVQVYILVENYESNCTVCYGIVGASL